MASDVISAFVGAVQASLSVLLTVIYGAIAAQLNLVGSKSTSDLSKTCVRFLLPALLFTQVGEEVTGETIGVYAPIFFWSIIYNVFLIAWGFLSVRLFGLPAWVTPAIAFNNTTALPLLLVQSLDSAGILNSILQDENDTPKAAITRAATYLLINSVVANCLTFAVGPQMLNAHEEDAPDQSEEKADDSEDSQPEEEPDVNDPSLVQSPGEETTLLPSAIHRGRRKAQRKAFFHGSRIWVQLPPWLQKVLEFLYQFLNSSVIAALLGLIVGLVPPLHKAFFNDASEGGVFNAWLTVSLKNTGGLFATLQTFTVGIKLAEALIHMKESDSDSEGGYPWIPSLFVELTRHALVPALSIPAIWFVAMKTKWLAPDPVLWFSMMIIPTGPPATKLTALADVSDYNNAEKMSISKFMAFSYIVSPVMAFAIVGSLKATQSAM